MPNPTPPATQAPTNQVVPQVAPQPQYNNLAPDKPLQRTPEQEKLNQQAQVQAQQQEQNQKKYVGNQTNTQKAQEFQAPKPTEQWNYGNNPDGTPWKPKATVIMEPGK